MNQRQSPLGGRRPTRDELADFQNGTVDDIVCPQPKLLIVGINPGLWTAAVNAPFAYPSNRFWPSLHEAGITPHRVDAASGLAPDDEQLLIDQGIGLTNLVNRATARADELTRDELVAGAQRLRCLADECQPNVIAILGITAYRDAFADRRATLGRQADLDDSQLWVLPQPSGLNAHATVPILADWWRRVARAAGL